MFNETITGFRSGPTSSGMMTWFAAVLSCGHQWHDPKPGAQWDPMPQRIGDLVSCGECRNEHNDAMWLESFDYSVVHHSRADRMGRNAYHFYRLDPASPSGFMKVGRSVKITPRIDAILKMKTNCGPLSPTEAA